MATFKPSSATNSAQTVISSLFGGPVHGRVPTLTWRHHEIIGVMQLVDSIEHRKHHTGGVKFYDVVTDTKYD
ncbi:MAG: HNH endonuclease [Phycisphaeraceae bacterium]